MVNDLQDGSEVVYLKEDSSTKDGLVSKRNKIACKFSLIIKDTQGQRTTKV